MQWINRINALCNESHGSANGRVKSKDYYAAFLQVQEISVFRGTLLYKILVQFFSKT